MKHWIGEYGKIVMIALLGGILLLFVEQIIQIQIQEKIQFPEGMTKKEIKQMVDIQKPEIHGLGTKKEPLSIKIKAGVTLDPLHLPGIDLRASDQKDGDLSDHIYVYEIRKCKDGTEQRIQIKDTIDISGKQPQYTLLYRVKNSNGFYAEQRVVLLISHIGG